MKAKKNLWKKLIVAMIFSIIVCGLITTETKAAEKKPTKITLKSDFTTVDINGKVTVSVKTVKPAKASKAVTYKSSDKKIATVNSKGVVTGKKAGTVTITATSKADKKIKATIKIKVKDLKPTALSLNISKASGYVGATKTIKATVKPANSSQKVTYTSNNKKVAKVSASGKITYVGPGKATITVKTGQKNKNGKYLKKTVTVTVKKQEEFTGKYVISAAKLKEKMDAKEKMVLVDTRGISSKKTTIKGAITLHWKDISRSTRTDGTNPGEAGYARTLDAKEMSEIMSAHGLGKKDQIILISDGHVSGGWGDDGRILWQLLQCGYTNLKMVDGGISAMKAVCQDDWKNYSQTGPKKATKKTVTIESVDQEKNSITTEALLALYEQEESFKVVDVRTDEEYNGAILYDEASGGHLKDAIHVRFTDLFRQNGTLKSAKELNKMFEAAGLSKEDKIITYCTGGIRSAYMQLVLEMCGYENSLNYAESVYRWSDTKAAGTDKYWVKIQE